MGAVKCYGLLLKNNSFQKLWDFLQLLVGGLKVRSDLKDNPASFHFLKVMYTGIGKVAVGEDQLFAGEGLDPGGLQANVFNHPILVIDHHKVPYFKRFIKKYHKGVE